MSRQVSVESLLSDLDKQMIRFAAGLLPRKNVIRRIRTITERQSVPGTVKRDFKAAARAQVELVESLRSLGALPQQAR